MLNILIIKPFNVTSEEAEKAIIALHSRYPDADISFMANLFPHDYTKISLNPNIDNKILFGPHAKRLTNIRLLKIIFDLRKRKYNMAFLLIGASTTDNYLKGKLLTYFSAAKERKLYFVDTKQESSLYLFRVRHKRNKFIENLCAAAKGIFHFAWSALSLIAILLFFMIFIVIPMRTKKLFLR